LSVGRVGDTLRTDTASTVNLCLHERSPRMPAIGIILGSTRTGRNGAQVARWVFDIASQRADSEFELVDLRDYPLPHLDEPRSPALGQYANDHTKEWAEKIASFDGFVFVTPEYNHSTSGVLKNAIDYLYAEWNDKAVGFVSYGSVGGARAAEHLRLIAGNLQMADVRQQVALSLITEFENFAIFNPGDYNVDALNTLLDQVVSWSAALAPLRKTLTVAGRGPQPDQRGQQA
jgi:NAD(P)H-dependent FMN reductase